MKILFIGDIFGKPGRQIIKEHLSNLKKEFQIDLVIANAENAAHGKGLTWKIYHDLMRSGVDYFSMGNHTWNKKEVLTILKENNIVRPANLSEHFIYHEGSGSIVFEYKNKTIRLTNLLGISVNFKNKKTQLSYTTNPFHYLEKLIQNNPRPDIHIVDFHCETTSEKNALMRSFNGMVEAIFGTHTHVPTNDYQIYNNTAYITDVGMTGPFEGIIGGDKKGILDCLFERSERFNLEVATGMKQFCSVLLEVNDQNQVVDFFPIILREDQLPTQAKIIQLKSKIKD